MPTNAWKATLILSIMLPVSLLATFKMSGVLTEPQAPETVTLEAVTWNMTRPTRTLTVDEWVNNSYMDNDNRLLSAGVHFEEHFENMLGWPSDGDDDVQLVGIHISVSVSVGFVCSFVANFSDLDDCAYVVLETTPSCMQLQNLAVKRIVNPLTSACLWASANNQSKEASLSALVYWVFLDQNNTDHWMTVDFEITYFDGTAYQTVITPFVLDVLVD